MTPYYAHYLLALQNTIQRLLYKGLLSLSALIFTLNCAAQGNASLATTAAQQCQDKMLDEALITIQEALAHPTENQEAYTWYVHGFVCKEIYKAREGQLRNSPMRIQAIDAFVRAENMHPFGSVSSSAPLKYLLSTLYNDAILSANDFTVENEFESDSLFAQYKRLSKISNAHTESEIKVNEGSFLKAKAQRYFDQWVTQPDTDYPNAMCIKYYSQALELDPTDCLSVYNIGVAYYNQALIRAKTEGLLLSEMTRVQIASSYFTKGLEMCPDDLMIQAAMQIITEQKANQMAEPKRKLSLKKK